MENIDQKDRVKTQGRQKGGVVFVLTRMVLGSD